MGWEALVTDVAFKPASQVLHRSEDRPRRRFAGSPVGSAENFGKLAVAKAYIMPRSSTSKPIKSKAPSPRGKVGVMDAVLSAATTLFAVRGPGSVSVRDIARV